MRLSICDRVVFIVPGIAGGVDCADDGNPRRDCAVGREERALVGVDRILSLIVTREFVAGLGLYKQEGSISFPKIEQSIETKIDQ